jgi:nicotinamide mononucleotide (NMN) deamidase PncC
MADALKQRAAHIVKLARERRMTLATVESCTAGTLANLLSQGEGASKCCTVASSSTPRKTRPLQWACRRTCSKDILP